MQLMNHSINQPFAAPFIVLVTLAITNPTSADPGDPIAVRRSDGCIVIESMWNLSVQIVTADQFRSTPMAGVDLMRVPAKMSSLEFRSRQDVPPGTTLDFTLDRPANQKEASWGPTKDASEPTQNAIRVRATGPLVVIDVDGVRITHMDDDTTELDSDAKALAEETDVLVIGSPHRSDKPSNHSSAEKLIDSRIVIFDSEDQANGNTVAVSAGDRSQSTSRRIIGLNSQPLTLPVELERLMAAKEASCNASQEVFAKLSTAQMNFRPGNGSHTPRWNAEHMMGRELLFFSQIFHAQDKAIPIMDLNPKQMPPDYVFRHPEWTGEEEARQMQRVAAFTSRFAYLLKDLPLDQKAPGSNWVLRGLLRQMDRHYSEHTANVKKKFELENWPSE